MQTKQAKSRFQAGRIKRIMQIDEEVGKLAVSVPVLVGRGVELFVGLLLDHSLAVARGQASRTAGDSKAGNESGAHPAAADTKHSESDAEATDGRDGTAGSPARRVNIVPWHLKQAILRHEQFDFLKQRVQNIPDEAPAPPPPKSPSHATTHKRKASHAAQAAISASAAAAITDHPQDQSSSPAPPPLAPKRRGRPPRSPKVVVPKAPSESSVSFPMASSSDLDAGFNATADLDALLSPMLEPPKSPLRGPDTHLPLLSLKNTLEGKHVRQESSVDAGMKRSFSAVSAGVGMDEMDLTRGPPSASPRRQRPSVEQILLPPLFQSQRPSISNSEVSLQGSQQQLAPPVQTLPAVTHLPPLNSAVGGAASSGLGTKRKERNDDDDDEYGDV